MRESDSESRISAAVSDGMKTLLLSLLAYLCLFAFEGGYCSWFGIPLELVKLDATRFLVFAGSVASFFVVVAPVLFAWFDNLLNGPKSLHPEANRLFVEIPLILGASFLLMMADANWYVVVAPIGAFLWYVLPPFGRSFIRTPGTKFLDEFAKERQMARSRLSDLFEFRFGDRPITLVFTRYFPCSFQLLPREK